MSNRWPAKNRLLKDGTVRPDARERERIIDAEQSLVDAAFARLLEWLAGTGDARSAASRRNGTGATQATGDARAGDGAPPAREDAAVVRRTHRSPPLRRHTLQ